MLLIIYGLCPLAPQFVEGAKVHVGFYPPVLVHGQLAAVRDVDAAALRGRARPEVRIREERITVCETAPGGPRLPGAAALGEGLLLPPPQLRMLEVVPGTGQPPVAGGGLLLGVEAPDRTRRCHAASCLLARVT